MTDHMRVIDIEDQWPELFEGLTTKQLKAASNTIAANLHEGWEPTYDDIRDLTDYARGRIDDDEYMARTLASAERLRAETGPAGS